MSTETKPRRTRRKRRWKVDFLNARNPVAVPAREFSFGHEISLLKVDHPKGRKRGRKRMALLHSRGDSHFYDPAHTLVRVISEKLQKPQHGQARTLHHRIGEVCNLPDPEENARSIAACIAKRLKGYHYRLAAIAAAMRTRILTPEEVLEVMEIVSRFDKSKKPGTQGSDPGQA